MSIVRFVRRPSLIIAWVTSASVLTSFPTPAQTTGYAVRETASAPDFAQTHQSNTSPAISTAGPVRLARFSFTQGDVTWRADDDVPWTNASLNQPVCQGAQISVGPGGRAEIQLDDGSCLRLGNGAIAVLQLLFSDAEGEFTQIKLTDGLASLSLKHNMSVYQVDTPLVSVKAAGPARLRIGVSDGVEVAVREGSAVVEGVKGKVVMNGGDYLDLIDDKSPYILRDLPDVDSWERWSDDRDEMLDAAQNSLERRQVPPDIAMIAGNLDAYGTWQSDAAYGEVWRPRVTDAAWRPYYAGRWVWIDAFGWTWCADEAWGWAPYHYGSWFHTISGWAWKPGPAHQYWSPATVYFTEFNGNIAWCPLAPSEIRYPVSILVGRLGGDWPTYFSIGAAGSYIPAGLDYCEGRAYKSTGVVGNPTPTPGSPVVVTTGKASTATQPFIPLNARTAAGVTTSTPASFVARRSYTQAIAGSTNMFVQGHPTAGSSAGYPLAFGPADVQHSPSSLTLSRSSVTDNIKVNGALLRTVFHMPVPPEPVHTGVAALHINSGSAGSSKSSASPVGGSRTSGSTPGSADARSSYSGVRSAYGSISSGGDKSPVNISPGAGVVGGHTVVGGSAPAGSNTVAGGGAVRGTPSPGAGSGGGSSPAGGNGAGRSTTGAPSGAGYHVGGGAPAGGSSPVRK